MAIACDLDCNTELNVIFKGTTPTFNFNVCLDTSLVDIENTHVIFTSGRVIVDKSGTDDIIIGDGVMSCSLTQEETMSFTGSQVNIQILVSMSNGQKPASLIMTIPVSSTLKGDNAW